MESSSDVDLAIAQTLCDSLSATTLTPAINDNEFTLFPRLPLELRRKIWCATLPGPRIVGINYVKETPTDETYGYIKSFAKIPVALLSVANTLSESGKVYFDFAIDRLYIFPRETGIRDLALRSDGMDYFVSLAAIADLDLVKRISIDYTILSRAVTVIPKFTAIHQETAKVLWDDLSKSCPQVLVAMDEWGKAWTRNDGSDFIFVHLKSSTHARPLDGETPNEYWIRMDQLAMEGKVKILTRSQRVQFRSARSTGIKWKPMYLEKTDVWLEKQAKYSASKLQQ